MSTPLEDLETELSSRPHSVLVLAGAGVARATDQNPCALWPGLLKNGVQRCRDRCHNLDDKWYRSTEPLIEECTAESLVQAASRIEKALRDVRDGEYGRWLSDSIGSLKLSDRRTIDAILSWKTRVATTNYDNLFEDASGFQPIIWDRGDLAVQMLRGELAGILHLHGHYRWCDSVVFGARTYEDICRDVSAQNYLRSIFTRDTIVFIGCGAGVDDPNFGGLLKWSETALKSCRHTHYHLVRESEQKSVAEQYRGFPVTPLIFGKNYADLAPFLEAVCVRVHSKPRPPTTLDLLVTGQSDFDSQRWELDTRTDLTPQEYVRRSFELARALWHTGGRRTAALHMSEVLNKLGSRLPDAEHLEIAIETVECLLDDHLDSRALHALQDANEVVQRLPQQSDGHTRFRNLLARCLLVRAELESLNQLIQDAIASGSAEERLRWEAQRAEYHMLNGDFAQLENDLGQEGQK